MARPLLVTKYRGTSQAEIEVFQNVGGILTSLFTYGNGQKVSPSLANFQYNNLATHWRGAIYCIHPGSGIFKNVPPATTATSFFQYSDVQPTNNLYNLDWQVVFKDGKSQLMTAYKSLGTNMARMVFIDEEDNVTETERFPWISLVSSMERGLNFGNKIYCPMADEFVNVFDPIAGAALQLPLVIPTAKLIYQMDLASHSGNLYAYALHGDTTVGKGNAIWNLGSAIPYIVHEWEGFMSSSLKYPGTSSQNCIFSDGENLICIGYPEGTTENDMGMFKITFDGNGLPNGHVDITSGVLGFSAVPDFQFMHLYATRDVETDPDEIGITLHMGFRESNGNPETTPFHSYQWNGPDAPATYLGLWGDINNFDSPSDKVGGGQRTFSNQNELNFVVTNIAPTGTNIDITYIIDGVAPASGVAMSIRYDNSKNTPLSLATVTPLVNGVTNGDYIEGLSTGESGVFRWNIAADQITPGDIPNLSAFLIKTL